MKNKMPPVTSEDCKKLKSEIKGMSDKDFNFIAERINQTSSGKVFFPSSAIKRYRDNTKYGVILTDDIIKSDMIEVFGKFS